MMRNRTLIPGARQPNGTAVGLPATPPQVTPTAELPGIKAHIITGLAVHPCHGLIPGPYGARHRKVQIPS